MMRRMFLKPSSPLIYMARAAMSSSAGVRPTVHCINTKRPQNEDPTAYYIRTLSTVLGSEEAAKEAFMPDFDDGVSGSFSALNLTPEQAHQLSKQPGVTWVEESILTYKIRKPKDFPCYSSQGYYSTTEKNI